MKDIVYLENTIPNLHGWCSLEKAFQLYNLVIRHDKPICVEIGVFAGRSLLPIALAAKAKKGSAVGIDAWSKEVSIEWSKDPANTEWWSNIDYDYFFSYTESLLIKAEVSTTTTLLRNKSVFLADNFEDNSISLLHQDGDHSEEATLEEVNVWYNKVKMGGHWVFNDTDWESTKKAQDLLLNSGYELIFTQENKQYKVFRRVDKKYR